MTFYNPATNSLWDHTLQAFSNKISILKETKKNLTVLSTTLLKGITVTVFQQLRWKNICTFDMKRKQLYRLRPNPTKAAYLFHFLCGGPMWNL